jgi:hypothetical protein
MALQLKSKTPKRSDDDLDRFREMLRIDKNNLDEEMLRQPFVYQDISEAYVNAAGERDFAKEALARVDAKLAEEFRAKAAKDKERTSETKIGDLVIRAPEHVEAHLEFAAKKRKADILSALQSSFDQRGKMLRELASLYVAGYFDRVVVKAGREETKNANAAIAKEFIRRKLKGKND